MAWPGTGRGFDEITINIGIGRTDEEESNATFRALGIDVGESTVDTQAAVEAIVADINARGGIGGRQINIVSHDVNTTQAVFNPAFAAQAACATWTQDNAVFAVTAPGLQFMDELVACLAPYDTPLLDVGGMQGEGRSFQDYYDRYPLYYTPGSMEAALYNRIAMRRLFERRFFEPWDTVAGGPASGPTAAPMRLGVNTLDNERGEQYVAYLSAELARYGIEITTVTRQSRRIENAPSDSQSAMLRFRSDGVTHIFGTGVLHHQFGEQQGYRPRYFMAHDLLDTVARTSPSASLRGSMGQSLVPAMATNEATYPGHPEGYLPCLAVLKAADMQPSTNLDHYKMQYACDAFYPLRNAIAASGVLSNDGLRDGFTALGNRPLAITWTSRFTDRRRASAIGLRDASFDEECVCYFYDSDINHYVN